MWEQESGNTFAGGYLQYLHTILFTKIYICLLFVGCPVVGRSCNSSSELPEENSIISIQEAYTFNECSGRLRSISYIEMQMMTHLMYIFDF